MAPQLGWHPIKDMKMSYAPSFRAPGGHIFDVVADGLKTEKIYIYCHVCTACTIGTSHAVVDLKVFN